jgi:hypothetical protein
MYDVFSLMANGSINANSRHLWCHGTNKGDNKKMHKTQKKSISFSRTSLKLLVIAVDEAGSLSRIFGFGTHARDVVEA